MKKYNVELHFTRRFAASIPKKPDDINSTVLSLTFKRDEEGIYYDARCVHAHLKDCAQQLAGILHIPGLRAKLASQVCIEPERLRFTRPDDTPIKEVDGTETRVAHFMTSQGPRNAVWDYIAPPSRLTFNLKVADGQFGREVKEAYNRADGVINRDILESIFEYGGTHGMGQERSQGWGQYEVFKFEERP